MATPGQSTDLTDFKSLVLAGATEDPEAIVELAKRYSSKLMSYAGSLGVDDPTQATQVALITALKAVDIAKPPSANRFEAEMFRAIRMGSSIEQGRPNGRTDTTSANGSDDGAARPPSIHAAGPIDVAASPTPPPADTRPPQPTAPPSIDPELLPPDFDPDLPLSEPIRAAPAVDPNQTARIPAAAPEETPGPPHQADSIPAPPEPPTSSTHRIEPDPTITADPIEPDVLPVPDLSPPVQPLQPGQAAQTTLDEPATVDEPAPVEERPNERVIANDVEVDDQDEFAHPGGWAKTTDLAPPGAMRAPQDVTTTDEHPLSPAWPTDVDLHDPRPPSLEPVGQGPPEGRGVFDVPVMGGAASTGIPTAFDPGYRPEAVGDFTAVRPPSAGVGAVEIGDVEIGDVEADVVGRSGPVPESDLLDTAQHEAIAEDVGPLDVGHDDGGYQGETVDGYGPDGYNTPDAYDSPNGYGPDGFDPADGYGADPYEMTRAVDASEGGDQFLDEYLPAESLASVEPADEAEILVDRRQPYVERRAPRTETGRAPARRSERRDRTDGRYNPVEDIGADPEASDNGRLKLLLLAAGPALLVVGLTIYLVTIQSDSLATRAPVPADGNPTATTTEPESAGDRATFGTEANAEPDADAGEAPATTVDETDDPTEPNVATSVTVTVEDNGTATGGDFSGETLVNVNLAGTDLAGADFSGSSLTNVDLSGADLVGADFTDAVLTDVNFERAEISGAEFTGATQIRSPINGRWNPNDPPTLP